MGELLECFLAGEEFTYMLATQLPTNNSEGVHLERMYPVRYSDKDYLPFVMSLLEPQYIDSIDEH